MVEAAAQAAMAAGELPHVALPEAVIERPSRPEHGDYATNLPLRLARAAARANPLDIAKLDGRAHCRRRARFARRKRRRPASSTSGCRESLAGGAGRRDHRGGRAVRRRQRSAAAQRVQVEFVSANPTGPLHVGNGRGASIGSIAGATCSRPPATRSSRSTCVNDAGTQTDVFGRTLLARYQQLFGRDGRDPGGRLPRRVRDRASRSGSRTSSATAS